VRDDPAPPAPPAPPRKKRSKLPLLLLGGLLLTGLCGGGGVAGLVILRPDLLAGIPVLEDLGDPGATTSGPDKLEVAIGARLNTLASQGVVQCGIHAKVTVPVTVTPAGVVQPGRVVGIPVPKKARCLETYLSGFEMQPAPTKALSFTVQVPQ